MEVDMNDENLEDAENEAQAVLAERQQGERARARRRCLCANEYCSHGTYARLL